MSSPALFLGGKVALAVAELDRAVHFYTVGLGFTLRLRVADDWAEVVSAGLVLALHRRDGVARHRREDGGPELSLEVEDLGAAIAELRARGVEPRPWLERDAVARGVVVLDPDGNALHLRQAVYAA